MTRYLASEGTPTAYGGRTVRVELAPDEPTLPASYCRRWTVEEGRKLIEYRNRGWSWGRIANALERPYQGVVARHRVLAGKGA